MKNQRAHLERHRTSRRQTLASSFTLLIYLACTLSPSPVLAADTAVPKIDHVPVLRAVLGASVEVTARIQDESGVFEPRVYFRRIGETEFNAIDMLTRPQGLFVATIPATLVTRDLEYFVEAFDTQGNGPARSGAPDRPMFIKVTTTIDSPSGSAARDLSGERAGLRPPANPIDGQAAPTEAVVVGDPVYKKWWFWTIIGVVAAGATVGILCATKTGICQDAPQRNFDPVTVRVAGGDVRDGL